MDKAALTPDRHNTRWCTLNGICTQLGMNVAHPSMVLSLFVRALGGSNVLVGALPAVRFGGWFLPQFLAAGWIRSRPRKAPVAVALEAARVLVYGSLAVLSCALGRSWPGLLLALFFVLFGVTRLTAGTGALARVDAIGAVIPPGRRAAFFTARDFWGGSFVFCAGFLVQAVLDPVRGWPFPLDFTLVFGLACGFFALAGLTFSRIREPEGAAPAAACPLLAQLGRGPAILRRDARFRRYLLARVFLTMVRVAEPFYPIVALDVLGAPASMVGIYLSATALSAILSNLLWRRVDRLRGTLAMLRASAALTLLAPLLAVALPWGYRALGFTAERYGLLPAYLFVIVFLLGGVAGSGRGVGLVALLLDIAPEEDRANYVGLVNTLLGLINFLPVLSGAAIDRVGFEPVFLAAAGLLLVGYLITRRL